MTRLEALESLYDEKMNQVFSYSGNWLMTIPRKGYEKEWQEARAIADCLSEMIEDIKSASPDGRLEETGNNGPGRKGGERNDKR